MISIDLMAPEATPGPFCEACGGRTRLAGVEPHPRLPRTDIRTYECEACESVQTLVAPHPGKSVNAIVVVAPPA
jgi:hypothetical protein